MYTSARLDGHFCRNEFFENKGKFEPLKFNYLFTNLKPIFYDFFFV